MYSADRFPVAIYSQGGSVGYAEGGLHDEALAVKRAGRHGDSRVVHVNDEEYRQMCEDWGEPTINPETGMPEFFLGKIFKAIKPFIPMAVSLIPGVGPFLAPVAGAALGATSGGGIKGALMGALSNAGPLAGSALEGNLAKAVNTTPAAAPAAAPAPAPVVPPISVQSTSPTASVPADLTQQIAKATTSTIPSTLPVRPNWWNRDVGFLGKLGTDLGIKNKHLVLAGGLLGAAGIDALRGKGGGETTPEDFFGPDFNFKGDGSSREAPGGFRLANMPVDMPMLRATGNPMDRYAGRYFKGFAKGGNASNSFAVRGPGTGRSDDIPAMLSDGEYVMDAETVSLLGDGSTKAGAERLDALRVKIRKHKGKKLAKGKFSQSAKSPEKYMSGGRS